MRKIILPAVALALITASTASFAATKPAAKPLTDTGAITAVDAKASTVTLADAKVFKASKKVLGKWKVGDNVVVTYKVVKTTNDATKIAAAPKA